MASDRALLERLNIHQLYAKANITLDANDAEGFVACFEQGCYVTISGLGEYNGLDELRGMVADSSHHRARHHFLNMYFAEESDEEVTCSAYFLLFAQSGEHTASGIYRDVVRRGTDGEWRFARREIDYVFKGPTYTHGR